MDQPVTIDSAELDVEAHRLASNDNETTVAEIPSETPDTTAPDDPTDEDVEGHRLSSNANETLVEA